MCLFCSGSLLVASIGSGHKLKGKTKEHWIKEQVLLEKEILAQQGAYFHLYSFKQSSYNYDVDVAIWLFNILLILLILNWELVSFPPFLLL